MLMAVRNRQGELLELLNMHLVKTFKAVVAGHPELPGVRIMPTQGANSLLIEDVTLNGLLALAVRQKFADPEVQFEDGIDEWCYDRAAGFVPVGWGCE